MKKALVNYWVDMVTGAAFLLCAVTGIVFLFPGMLHTAAGAAPTILLMPAAWWHTVHDWTGVAMVAGTALHLALHAKWIATMTRRILGAPAETGPARSARPAPAADSGLRPAAGAAIVAAAARSPLSPASAQDEAAASLERLGSHRDERRREHEQRISRRRFLAGAALVGGAALVAGVGLAGRDAVSDASTRLNDDGWTDSGGSGSGGSGSSANDVASGSSANGAASGSSANSAQSAASGGAGTTQVVVDQSACIACGRCLEVCPAGVFDWSASGRAEAVNADACIRCGRCLQACPAGAITVSA